MPLLQPYLYIDPPMVEPYAAGIFGAGQELTDGILTAYDERGAAHWMIGGVEWENLASYTAGLYPMGPNTFGGTGGTKTLTAGLGLSRAIPFAVYAGMTCGSVGYTREQWNQRALRALELSAQHAVELALWTGAGGNTPALNATGTTDVTAGVATELVQAVGLLENWLADNYGGRGVIHAKRRIALMASSKHIVKHDPASANPGAPLTPVGSRWVFGGGYNGTGPAAAAPTATQTWIYASGGVVYAKGGAQAPATLEAELNRTTNQVFALAEQPWLVGIDGPKAAALVDLTK